MKGREFHVITYLEPHEERCQEERLDKIILELSVPVAHVKATATKLSPSMPGPVSQTHHVQ